MIAILRKLGTKGNFLNFAKEYVQKNIANVILNDEKLKIFPLISGTK